MPNAARATTKVGRTFLASVHKLSALLDEFSWDFGKVLNKVSK